MSEDMLWEEFARTGSVADYLRYISQKDNGDDDS
jgi:hypothetical protein